MSIAQVQPEYGTKLDVVVISSSSKCIGVVAEGIKEGFFLMNHGLKVLPSVGDHGTITFVKGGVLKGYWEFKPTEEGAKL